MFIRLLSTHSIVLSEQYIHSAITVSQLMDTFTDCPRHMYKPKYLTMMSLPPCTGLLLQLEEPEHLLLIHHSVPLVYLFTLLHVHTLSFRSDHWWATILYLSVSISLCLLPTYHVFATRIQWSTEEPRCSCVYNQLTTQKYSISDHTSHLDWNKWFHHVNSLAWHYIHASI